VQCLWKTRHRATQRHLPYAIRSIICRVSQVNTPSWWRGVVGNAFRMKRTYSTPGLVST